MHAVVKVVRWRGLKETLLREIPERGGLSLWRRTATHPPATAGGTDRVQHEFPTFEAKSRRTLLCATSVFSVSLWCVLLGIDQPQTHREHREHGFASKFGMALGSGQYRER